jgi:hypothetical protein
LFHKALNQLKEPHLSFCNVDYFLSRQSSKFLALGPTEAFKGTVFSLIVPGTGSFQATYWISQGFFSNLPLNYSRKYSCLNYYPLLLMAASQYSSHCLVWRVVNPCIIYSWELQMYEFFTESLSCCLMCRVFNLCLILRVTLLPTSFVARSYC